MECKLDTFRHPVFVHVRVLVPNLLLGHCAYKSAPLVGIEKVGIKLHWRRKRVRSTNLLTQNNPEISQLYNQLFHVIILDPEMVGIGFRYFPFEAFHLLG